MTRKQVVVAEDDENIRMILRTILGEKFDIKEAEDAIQAFDSYRRVTDDTGKLPVLVTDNQMPRINDGVNLCIRLAEEYDGFKNKGILVSSDNPEDLTDALHQKGVFGIDVFRKPVDYGMLMKTIESKFDEDNVYEPQGQSTNSVNIYTPSDHNILVVDDDDSVRGLVYAALTRDGYNVTLAENGREGLDKLLKPNADFKVVLTDVVMTGLTGIDFYNFAPKEDQEKIIFMTGTHGDDELVKRMGFLQKPFTLKELYQIIENKIKNLYSGSTSSQQQEQH